MKRLFSLTVLIALLLSACGERQSQTVEPTPTATIKPIEEVKVSLTPEDRPLTDWQRAYLGLLEAQEWGQYAFFDLDKDGIPEFFLLQQNGTYDDPADVEVYTYLNGAAHSVGCFQVPYLYSDRMFYICPDRAGLLCETVEDGIITGRGGNWVTLVDGKLQIEPAFDETIPFVEREEGPSPVLDGEELPTYRVWWEKTEPMPLPLPLLYAAPQPSAVATEEKKTAGEARLEAVLENREMLYAVSGWPSRVSSAWMYLWEYCGSEQIDKYNGMEDLHIREVLSQDLNGDGINERILFLEEGPGQLDAHRTAVLSCQEGVVYAYLVGNAEYRIDETGTFWVNGSDLLGERLYFDRDQFYTVENSIPQPKLLYHTTSETDPDTGIRRTTLDPQGLDLSIWYETPFFPEQINGYRKINTFFENLEREFFSPRNENLVWAWGYSIPPCSQGHCYVWTAQVTELTNKLVSVHLWRYWFMGGVNDKGGEGYTFRTDTGELLSLTDLAQGSEEEIRSAILDAFETCGYFTNLESVLAEAKEYPLEDFTFFLTPEGFFIHLARYELGRVGAESDTTIFVEGLSLQERWRS